MLHHDNAPAHTSLLICELLAKQEMTVIPPTALLSRFGPCGLSFVPKVEIHSERSPISDDRGARRKFATGSTHYPAKRVPELEKTEAVYRQWRVVL
jgi:hypothetical protein